MSDDIEDLADETMRRNQAEQARRGRKEQRKDNGHHNPYGRLRILSVAELMALPPRDYIVKGWISPAEMSLFVGAPKCGKTFLALHVAYAIPQARWLFGRRVKAVPTLYAVAEGERGVAQRVEALERRYGQCDGFHVIAQPVDLLHPNGDLSDLIVAAKAYGIGVIFLDTVSRMLAGGDENAPSDMGRFVMNMNILRHETGAHIVGIHHGPQSDATKSRGHNSLPAAVDVITQVAKQDDGDRTALIAIARDDPDGAAMSFRLEPVDFGRDEDGDPITTLEVIEADGPPVAARPAAGDGLTKSERIALRSLDRTINAQGLMATVFDDGTEGIVAREADWRTCFYREGMPGAEQDTKQKAFKRAIQGLLSKERIGSRDDFVWPKAPAA